MNINPSEVRYEIWQTEKHGVAYFNVEGTTINIQEDEYEKTYEGENFKAGTRTDQEILNDLYLLHNSDDRPCGRTMRSLSISDIVVIEGRAYACESIGWKRVWLNEED